MWRRTARASWSAGRASVAPNSRASRCWWAYLAPTSNERGAGQRPVAARWASAAVTVRPKVPAPSTATTSPSRMPAPRTACTAQATGSMVTASASLNAVGHGEELAGMRHQAGGRPPAAGVGAEAGLQAGSDMPEGEIPAVPHVPGLRMPRRAGRCRGRRSRGRAGGPPGSRPPGPTRPHRRRRRRAARPPRGRGRRGTRRSLRSSASCARPRWRGPSRRCPTAAGSTWTHPSPGSAGASCSTSRSGPTPAPRPEPKLEAMRAAAKRGSERSKSSVLIWRSPPWATSRRRAPAAAAGASRPAPWTSARRASRVGGRWPPGAPRD